jgi:para-aminobenzoate synthetase/4-amino-4-deoxychorismate lyase
MRSLSTAGDSEETATAIRVELESTLSFEQAARWLRDDTRPFALSGDWLGGLWLLGSEPVRVASADEDPFAAIERQASVDFDEAPHVAVALGGVAAERPVVGGGWIGWFGYGLGGLVERLPPPPPAPVPRAAFSLAYYDHVIVFDGRRWWFEALWSEEREQELRSRLALWEARLSGSPPAGEAYRLGAFRLYGSGGAGHIDAVSRCRERIAAGELFQANVCVRLQADWRGDALDLFGSMLRSAQPRFGALVDGAVSLSPERFLRRIGREVWTEPIKGTRPRPDAVAEQHAAREELIASGKDAAEHVMIVDLMRNDLGRVCEYGSIHAEAPRVEAHAGVWHLVSTVSGTLRERVGDGQLLRAAFPPGSVTGAPKVQAMKVIAELECSRRELYTGAIGISSPIAGLDLSVAIRTFEFSGRTAWFGAGGGIVADSEPELELAEALDKARGPLTAVGAQLSAQRPGSAGVRPSASLPRALADGARPDPAAGVFETILVRDGYPVALAPHLERLAASALALYGVALELPALMARAREACEHAGAGPRRLRALCDRRGETAIELADVGAIGPVRLAPFMLPGGLGAHKWQDRRLLGALSSAAPGTVPLVIDADGAVLEAGFANIWILEGEELLTPPADGRLLPGVTRAALLDREARAREESFDLKRMRRCDSIILSSSLCERRPAELADLAR